MTTRRSRGSASAKSSISSNFCWSRRVRQSAWYRYCLRPAASTPVAWRWPRGCMQIHTSSHAGGIASSRMRASVSSSSTRSPSASRNSKPRPRRRRVMPGSEQSTRLNLAIGTNSRYYPVANAPQTTYDRSCPGPQHVTLSSTLPPPGDVAYCTAMKGEEAVGRVGPVALGRAHVRGVCRARRGGAARADGAEIEFFGPTATVLNEGKCYRGHDGIRRYFLDADAALERPRHRARSGTARSATTWS